MGRLGAVAHYQAKGDRNAHVAMEDALENRGYALWLSCQGKIRTSKASKVTGPPDRGVGDVLGYEIEVNLKRKVFDLWPGLNQMDRASQDAFISEIYAYLRASGNAICVRKPGLGEHGIPLWWLRETWNDVKAVGIYRQTELTAREKRLTPQEAGEDRAPSPVTVRQREEAAAAAAAADESKGKAGPDEIISLLKQSPQPLYQREIADGLKMTSLTAGRHLRDLEEAGKIHRRLEGKGERPDDASGRYRYLYWHAKKIPLRQTPLDVQNRTMDRVNSLKPGESLAIHWMSPGPQREVQELVDAGILEYFERIVDGKPEKRIRLTSTAPVPVAEVPAEIAQEPAKPEPAPVPAPAPTYTGMEAIGKAISQLIEDEVEKRTGGLQLETLRQELAHERETIGALRLEVSNEFERAESAERERDRLQAQLDGIRKSLGL